MRILFERNIATKYISAFESEPWVDVEHCDDHLSATAKDEEIAKFASEKDFVVFTIDTDFFGVDADCGVLYFDQYSGVSPREVVEAVRKISERYADHSNIQESITGKWI